MPALRLPLPLADSKFLTRRIQLPIRAAATLRSQFAAHPRCSLLRERAHHLAADWISPTRRKIPVRELV